MLNKTTSMEKLVNRDFRKATDFFTISHIPLLYQVKPLTKHYANMSNYFDSPRLKAAFTFQDVYMGLSPFEASATFSFMQYSELAHGVWYPKGGMYQIIEALMTLANGAGVDFVFNKQSNPVHCPFKTSLYSPNPFMNMWHTSVKADTEKVYVISLQLFNHLFCK